jgi:hypothetical protein
VGNAKWPDITDPAVRQILQGDINDPAIQQTMRRYAEKKFNVESGMKPSEPTPKPDDKKNTLQDASGKESVLKAAVPRDEQRATTQYAEDAWYAEDACYYETHFNNRNLEIEVLKELALTELEGQSLELQSRSVEVKNLKTLLCEMRGRMHRLLGSCLREELAGHKVQVERAEDNARVVGEDTWGKIKNVIVKMNVIVNANMYLRVPVECVVRC